ncbi:MAG: peptide ABC transporter substrate-binding protein [Brevefilum sp.]|nr:peptide ABC transporter substrate-binding protein [Brevefilum sp.]MDT8381179.1 peptide ABC transporter substrate-binding protein [Brevefilum sp.]
MKKYRWQLLIVLVTGLIVGILLIIQQMDDGEEIQSTPSPISGGVYTEALIGEFMRLNPFLDLYNEPDRAVDQLIFNNLVKFDSRGIPQSDLAESWGVSRDGTVYNFSLRTDVYWHDGEPFNSQDVLYTTGLLQSQHNLIPVDLRNFWAEVEVVALSDVQLQFLLPEPFAPFLDYLSFGILPEHILGGLGMDDLVDHPYNLAPVGTGPFRFQRLIVENEKIAGVVLEAFDAYFQERPYLDEFIFRYYPSSQDALAAFREGEVEGIGKVHSSILSDILSEPDLSVYTTREPLLTMTYLNLNNPEVGFLQNPDFRRALLAAINRDAIIEQVFNGQAVQANGPILPGTWAHYNDLEKVPFNFVEAKRLFESTGVTFDEEAEVYRSETDLEISLTLLHPDTAEHTQIAEQIQADWEKLGVNVTLESKPYENVLEDLSLRNYETALVDINFTRSPDPDPYPFWGQAQVQSGQNYAEWDNRSASEFLEQARMTSDIGERERLYRNFQVLFMRELPSLPLFYPVYTYAVTEDINGIKLGPLFEPSDRFNNVHEWYILSGVNTNGENNIEATDSAE